LGGERTTLSPAVAYEILPQLLRRAPPERNGNLLTAFRAGAGFDSLIAKRGRHVHADAESAAPRRTRGHQNVEATDTPALEVGVAESPDHLAAADTLIRQRYAWRGYTIDSSEREHAP
jgi:hypothetical protein